MKSIIIEDCAYEGVKRIAKRFAEDFKLVYGYRPRVKSGIDLFKANKSQGSFVFISLDNTEVFDSLNRKFKIKVLGKRECYQIIKDGNDIYVVGSDKRGTIYGIFDLSEQIGVTPFLFWGDANPSKRDKFSTKHIRTKVSMEPSVEYRGFFVNDEWPCFGNWTFSHFGGFTAKMYEQVFEFLLRLKGNCLWPAMWSSSFALDGPGNLNEELADIYGVVISYSHHEPCLRASEEWDIYKGENTEYGTEWNYLTNKNGLHNYWRDGLIRSEKYENIITMGMRGERDSKMQGAESLEECINTWKEIIKAQDELIDKYVTDKYNHPKLVAIYKEVEKYFYGNDSVNGLCGLDILDDKLLMFCEDNFGYMRRLPEGDLVKHKGGLGMYYHLDYHGEPVSYEWINTTPLSKIWEQMCVAYNHGINKMWIVNVGDLKGNEYPLSYFLAMAYDYDKWGDRSRNSYTKYAESFAKTVFNNKKVADVLTAFIDVISLRRPEALSKDTFSLMHGEVDLMIDKCNLILKQVNAIKEKLSEEKLPAYFSMVEYPITIGINHLLLHLYAKKNEHYAYQGKCIANKYADLVDECYKKEEGLKKRFAAFNSSKWRGMELANHTGFTKWNDFGRKNPVICRVKPQPESHMIVSLVGSDFVASKTYGDFDRIVIDDYNFKGDSVAAIEVAVDGICPINCTVSCDNKHVHFKWTKKKIKDQELLKISVDTEFKGVAEAKISDGDTTVILELKEPKDYIVLDAVCDKKKYENCVILEKYGKHGNGIKLLNDASVLYEFESRNSFEGVIELCFAPTNSYDSLNQLCFSITVNGKTFDRDIITPLYMAGDPTCCIWAEGVLDNERRVSIKSDIMTGKNIININSFTEGIILEKIFIHSENIGSTYTGI